MQRRHFLFFVAQVVVGAYAKAAGASLELVNKFSGLTKELFHPGSEKFNELKKLINPALTPHDPLAILQSPSSYTIKKVIESTESIPLRVRSGGHSFEGFSIGAGLVVDVRKLKQLRIVPAGQLTTEGVQTQGHVVAGAGLTLSELQKGLAEHGLMFPVGSCPTVGLAGYLLGGGHSLKSRLHGLGADRVQSMKVILASGESLIVSPKQHADLYWALLGGGGGNFAVVEEFHLDLIPLTHKLVFDFMFSGEKAQAVFELWENLGLEGPEQEAVVLILTAENGKVSSLQVHGVVHEVDSKSQPEQFFLATAWKELKNLDPQSQRIKLQISSTMRPEGITLPFKGTSHYADQKIEQAGFLKLQKALTESTLGSTLTLVFEPMGGRITSPARSNSYPHRASKYLIEYYTGWVSRAKAARFKQNLLSLHRSLDSVFAKRSYINYCDLNLPTDWAERYYADSLPRLLEVKKLYDPDNRFDYGAQSLNRLLTDTKPSRNK